MRVEDFKQGISKANSLVTAAQRLLRNGQVVDLTALEAHVRELTENARTLSDADREKAKLLVVALMNDLDQLHRELADQHAELERQLKSVNQTSRAAMAYGSTQTRR